MKLKVGIIGFGTMGKIRKDAIIELARAEVIAISDPSLPVHFNELANLSHSEIINHPDVNIIIVCTPNFLNKKLTIDALNAGKHVFCEKPPAFTGSDMIEIREAEKMSRKKLMYGFNHRHHDSIIKMKELIESGEYGKVLWSRGRYGKSVTEDYYNQWRA